MISLSIHAIRFFTKATAFDLSMAWTWRVIARGTDRSMMSARQRSDSSLPNLPSTRTWHHVSPDLKQEALPSGLKSREEGHTKSFVVSPPLAPTASQENRFGFPGRSSPFRTPMRSAPERVREELLILARVCSASPRIRASLGTAASTEGAPTAKVR